MEEVRPLRGRMRNIMLGLEKGFEIWVWLGGWVWESAWDDVESVSSGWAEICRSFSMSLVVATPDS